MTAPDDQGKTELRVEEISIRIPPTQFLEEMAYRQYVYARYRDFAMYSAGSAFLLAALILLWRGWTSEVASIAVQLIACLMNVPQIAAGYPLPPPESLEAHERRAFQRRNVTAYYCSWGVLVTLGFVMIVRTVFILMNVEQR